MVKPARVAQLRERLEQGTLSSRDLKTVDTLRHALKKQPAPKTEGERLSLAFGKMVEQARLKKGWTREQLAEAAGWHKSYIAQLEGGFKRNLQMETLAIAAAALDLELKITLEE